MWRKGVFFLFLLSSLLLAGAAEARLSGSGSPVLGSAVPGTLSSLEPNGFAQWLQGRVAMAAFRSQVVGEGDVGSHIDPDGGRLRATVDPNG